MRKKLPSVTLLGLDCINIDRLIQAAEICKKDFEFAEVKLLTSLPSSHPDVIQIPPVSSTEAYSHFMVHTLDHYVDTEHVLIVQYDGFILNPQAWTDDFLLYDYIGAPWWKHEKLIVGNGGFCMRSKKLVHMLATDPDIPEIPKGEPEDVYICRELRDLLESKGIHFAPVDVARKFSIEMNEVVGGTWTDQFGFHGLRWTDIGNWLLKNPEYKIDNTLVEKVVDGRIVKVEK